MRARTPTSSSSPTYISPIAVIFNVEGVDDAQPRRRTIAGIFAGTITKWNDLAIAALNEGATLPDLAITPVHRSDDSGTTENFTDYLVCGRRPTCGPTRPTACGRSRAARPPRAPPASWTPSPAAHGTIGYADAFACRRPRHSSRFKVGDEFVEYSPEAAAAIVDASPRGGGRAEGDIAIEIDRTSTRGGRLPDRAPDQLHRSAASEYADADRGARAREGRTSPRRSRRGPGRRPRRAPPESRRSRTRSASEVKAAIDIDPVASPCPAPDVRHEPVAGHRHRP